MSRRVFDRIVLIVLVCYFVYGWVTEPRAAALATVLTVPIFAVVLVLRARRRHE